MKIIADMPRQILGNIIQNFNADRFADFFRAKTEQWGNFRPADEAFTRHDDGNFQKVKKLGQIEFENNSLVIICAESILPLSERSGKKSQYDKAKGILKQLDVYSAGIFIYYDPDGNFRFSLIYPEYYGPRRKWSNFRRFTYFVSKKLTNKTFLQIIGDGDFSGLEKIKEAFSVEKVTKTFYTDIANWYFWAVKNSVFPKDAESEKNGRNIAVIRLITRLIFIWFMRERGLVSDDFFNKNKVGEILKDLTPDKTTYYKAVLQNLFFATLSTRQRDRKFRSEIRSHKGYNPDFGNHAVYRYHEYFRRPEKIKDYFGKIPFLNGGLFECLDDKKNKIYIDGFSSTNKNQPSVPNFLFFSDETSIDLNAEYGTANKKYKVRGLIDTLSSYNFTIDENDPNDQEVALDPELLGKVFENLLASFNPETASTARKATGSYYTPREIVDYMVTESLKQYFRTHLTDVSDLDEKLANLFSPENSDNLFDSLQSKRAVNLIESIRIVDPAVGSGAFPMGILNKLVFILSKLDPDNKLWKQEQLNAVDKNIPDPVMKKKLKDKVIEQFAEKNFDYGRKLYLIQKCIYGVDIQQTAVEIAKLRFFISLLVDEKIDKGKENWGIEPLPNLDYKIMVGNSLIELLNPKLLAKTLDQERNRLIEELDRSKAEYATVYDTDIKKRLREKINSMVRILVNYDQREEKEDTWRKLLLHQGQTKIFEDQSIQSSFGDMEEKLSRKLEKLDKLKDILDTDHFEWHLNFNEVFNEKGGFDVVIANPPYLFGEYLPKSEKEYFTSNFDVAKGQFDVYWLFLEQGIRFLKQGGLMGWIIPDSLLARQEPKIVRRLLLAKTQLLNIIHAGLVFSGTGVSAVVLVCRKGKAEEGSVVKIGRFDENSFLSDYQEVSQDGFLNQPNTEFTIFSDDQWGNVQKKIEQASSPLTEFVTISRGEEFGKASLTKQPGEGETTILAGADIEDYLIHQPTHFINSAQIRKKTELYQAPKLVIVKTGDKLACALDEEGIITLQSVYNLRAKDKSVDLNFLLGILNSKLLTHYVRKRYTGYKKLFPQITQGQILSLPIAKLTQPKKKKFADKLRVSVRRTTNLNMHLLKYKSGTRKQKDLALETDQLKREINQVVYKLYDLTPEEIEIVEGNL